MSQDSGIAVLGRSNRRAVAWAFVVTIALSTVGLCHWLKQVPDVDSDRTDFQRRFRGGSLLIAGGGTLPAEIRERFLDLAGGSQQAHLVVIPAYDASESQIASLSEFWRKLGVASVQVLHARSRAEANQQEFAEPLDSATGVWLSGGTQSWLSAQYAGTQVEDRLQAVVRRGGVVGGSSAGAAAMSKVMIEQGLEEAVEGVGFDLLQGAIVDQHFLRRSRLNRLLRLMQSHPDLIAFGIDEETALVVQVPHGRLGVIGASYVLAYVPSTDAGPPRFEILKHRDQIDLAGLKSGTVRVSSPADLEASLSE